MVVLDTCAILELLKEKPSFSEKSVQLIESHATILSVSFAEIACKIKTGKLILSISTRDLFHKLCQVNGVEIVDINVSLWLDSIDLIWHEHKDPADRIITAYAIKHELPIITTDLEIKKFYHHVLW